MRIKFVQCIIVSFFENLLKIFRYKKEKNQYKPISDDIAIRYNKDNQASSRDFINSIIHELKNPLNAIAGYTSLASDELKNSQSIDKSLEYISEIEKATSDLNELIHDLLDVGYSGNFRFSVDVSKLINVRDVIARSVRLNYDFAVKRNIVIKSQIDEDISLINLDSKRTKQILANLISNSIKYSPSNTVINVVAKNINHYNHKFLRINIIDQGFGMNQEQLKNAFEKYQTIHNPNSGMVDSFGLGLPIVKELVELQKGQIFVKSVLGMGSEFIIEFPY